MFSIEEYREAVSSFASSHRNYDIKNEGDDCARVIFANLFLNSTKTIRMVANTLRNVVVDSQEYQDCLDAFLSREGTVLRIIINHLPDNAMENSNSNLYRRLSLNPAYADGRIQIRNAGKDRFFLGKRPVNFCVADGLMYRVEDDIEKRTALCNFGNPKKAEALETAFDSVFSSIKETVDLKQMFE